MANAGGSTDQPSMAKKEREEALVARFQSRLGHVLENFRACRKAMAGRRTFNESIDDLRTAQRPRAERAQRARLDPEIEFLCAWKLKEQGIADPESAQVMTIAKELSATLKPTRGRPPNRVLKHHVEGLVLLFEETCGSSVRQCQAQNSDYGPRLKGHLGKALLQLIKSVDPRVTETAVANIIRAMPRSDSRGRRRFCDYFPMADHADAVPDELPGLETKNLGVIWPIYCS